MSATLCVSALMRIRAMNCTKSLPPRSPTCASAAVSCRANSSGHRSTSLPHPYRGRPAWLPRILDPVGKQRLETHIATNMLAHSHRVERNLQSAFGGCLLDDEVFIGLLVISHRLARLYLALVLKQFFVELVHIPGPVGGVVVQMQVAAALLLPPWIQPRMDIENLIIKFAVSSGPWMFSKMSVYGLQQPFIGQRHRQGESITVLHQSVHVFPAVEPLSIT